jgi:hypothetical protein
MAWAPNWTARVPCSSVDRPDLNGRLLFDVDQWMHGRMGSVKLAVGWPFSIAPEESLQPFLHGPWSILSCTLEIQGQHHHGLHPGSTRISTFWASHFIRTYNMILCLLMSERSLLLHPSYFVLSLCANPILWVVHLGARYLYVKRCKCLFMDLLLLLQV